MPINAGGCSRCWRSSAPYVLPSGPICLSCRIRIAYHPAVCPGCFELRPIAYLVKIGGDELLGCAACANQESVFACTGCGREDHPYGAMLCARCTLTDRLAELLTDPDTGQVKIELRPVFEELVTARRPQSVISWMQKPPATGVRLLERMARGELPITHDAFRALPPGRAENYLRALLTATGVLPPYHPAVEQMERWLDTKLAPLSAEANGVIGRYARWYLLRRLRAKAERGELTRAAIYQARSLVNGAIRLCEWAVRHGHSILTLTQPQLEDYLSEYPGGRNSQQHFVSWLRRTRTNPAITIPWQDRSLPEIVVSDDARWEHIDLLLHDDSIEVYARIGGLFTLLFAQPLVTVIGMRRDQVTLEDDGRVLVTFDTIPIEMPPVLDSLIRRYLERPGTPSIASADHGWLFPGRHPGQHLVSEVFRAKLVAHGIRPGNSRHAAMFSLAAEVPTPVLAELIGIGNNTAARWAALAGRNWSAYVAQRQQ